MKPTYSIQYCTREDTLGTPAPYSRKELADQLRNVRKDGMRGRRFDYPPGSEFEGWIVKRFKSGNWFGSNDKNEWFLIRKAQP